MTARISGLVVFGEREALVRARHRHLLPDNLLALLLCAFSAFGTLLALAAVLAGSPLLGASLFLATVFALIALLREAAGL